MANEFYTVHIDTQVGTITNVPFTTEELTEVEARQAEQNDFLLNSLRWQRNQLLAETDYLALSDSTLTDEMRTYRQALRDLPANTADPANPVWPVKPGGDS